MDLPDAPEVVDLGAGTGNFVCELLTRLPEARVVHVDNSADMNRIARGKYSERKLDVQIVESYMQTVQIPPQSKDLVVCVNALNNAPPVRPVLSRIYSWLKDGGYFFLIDFGREINVTDWTWYLLKHVFAEYNLRQALSIIRRQAKVISINRGGQDDQHQGTLWTHSSEELGKILIETGFKSIKSELCYRDYADLFVVQKPRSICQNTDCPASRPRLDLAQSSQAFSEYR
jgi:ubiquinone/menaquinone biosynthesis C-methylase UbiE